MTIRKGADRLPDSTLFVYIIPQPRRNCNGGAVVLLATVNFGMFYDAFRDSGSAYVACNGRFWRVRYSVQDLSITKNDFPAPLERSFLVIDLPERC